jgi:hypothetical protein
MVPGYSSWSSRTGQVMAGPSSFNPMAYQQKNGQQQQYQTPDNSFDWSAMLGKQQAAPSSINTQTSINPQPIYNAQQTAYAKNQGVGNAYAQANPYSLAKELDRPGFSRGAANARNMLPAQMQGRAQAAQAQAEIPFSDAAANAQQMLQGQTARENEALGWGAIGSGIDNNNQQRQLGYNNQAMTLLSALLGI